MRPPRKREQPSKKGWATAVLTLAILPGVSFVAYNFYYGYISMEELVTGFDIMFLSLFAFGGLFIFGIVLALAVYFLRRKLSKKVVMLSLVLYWVISIGALALGYSGITGATGYWCWDTFVLSPRVDKIRAMVSNGEYKKHIESKNRDVDGYEFKYIFSTPSGVVFVTREAGGVWHNLGLFIPFNDDGKFHEKKDEWFSFAGNIEKSEYDGVYWWYDH